MEEVLRIEHLWVEGRLPGNDYVPIVKDVNFTVRQGEVVALIGESGSGKTTISLAALGYARPGCRISKGRILMGDRNILKLSNKEKREMRGRSTAYVAQSAAAAFNPAMTIDYQVTPLMQKDSLEMTPEDRNQIRLAVETTEAEQVVITHGTDTMIGTGKALQNIPGKTIVLTGAMQPARFRASDALYNIASALTAVQILPAGVYIAMNGRIFDPLQARKNVEANRFEVIISKVVRSLSPATFWSPSLIFLMP